MTKQPARVRGLFGSIARRYDLANHLLSCGMDYYWRRRAAEIVSDWRPHTIVDVATGTGDLALALRCPVVVVTRAGPGQRGSEA